MIRERNQSILSANQIRDNIKRLLGAFGLPQSTFALYLREDRDAG